MAVSFISDLEVRLVRLEFRQPVRYGLDWISGRDVAIVRLTDEAGRVGLGETFEQPHQDAVATARSWAIGRTPMELLVAGGPWVLGVLPHRLCGALEGAIADLEARQSDVSLARSLAGTEVTSDVPVNALLVATAPSPDVVGSARALVAEGFATVKLKLEGGADGVPWRMVDRGGRGCPRGPRIRGGTSRGPQRQPVSGRRGRLAADGGTFRSGVRRATHRTQHSTTMRWMFFFFFF